MKSLAISYWRWKVLTSLLAVCACVVTMLSALATDISLGSVAVLPGGTVQMQLRVSNAAPGISAFAVWLTNAPGFATPTVTAGPAQPNLTTFLDARSNGLLRVTGLILSGAPVTNGHVATLQFTAPPLLNPGVYPVLVAGTVAPNPELRTLITSDLLPASGAGGFIFVPGALQLTSLLRSGGTFQFSFDGASGIPYRVNASTNLIDWTVIGSATQIAPGLFQFTDPDADLFLLRFYKVRVP